MTISKLFFSMVVACAPALAQLNGGPLPNGSVGVPYSYRFNVHSMGAGPFYFSVNGTLPPGISLSLDGLLSGTPAQAGYYPDIVIHASSAGGLYPTVGSNTYSLTITGPPAIRTRALPRTLIHSTYSTVLQGEQGLLPYTWRIAGGNFPPTLTLNPDTGELHGAVRQAGSYTFSIEMRDAAGRPVAQQFTLVATHSCVSLSRTALRFGYVNDALVTGPQSLTLTYVDTQARPWTAVSSQPNIMVTPSSGTSDATLQITARPGSSGTVTVSAICQAGPAPSIAVTITPSANTPPFGAFDTPLENSTVSGAVPVTGWTLDNVEVTKLEVMREPVTGEQAPPGGLVYIGDAVFIPGTRPDVENTFPAVPLNYRGGWGYHMLTNFLPNSDGSGGRGNGVYRFWALAHDREGNVIRLGPRTVSVNNASAVMPFGTIDLPAQGGTISGASYRNSGWALTPQPCAMPLNLQGTSVFIDGQEFPNVLIYSLNRQDVASLFPNYRNSAGSYAYWEFDTTRFANGVHTIAWSALDECGHREGLGSRFFFVQNSGTADAPKPKTTRVKAAGASGWRRGFDRNAPLRPLMPGEDGAYLLEVEEMDRLEIHLGTGAFIDQDIPAGASIEDGVFYWLLAPGYLNEQRVLLRLATGEPVNLRVFVRPKK